MAQVPFTKAISGSILVAICGQLRQQVDDKNLGPGPYYDRWQRLKQTEKLRESLEDSMVICDHHGDGAPIAGWFVNVYQGQFYSNG